MALSLDELVRLGFDESYSTEDTYLKVKCGQCDALVINGVPCHETGCQNKGRECFECGCHIPAGESCDCMSPVFDEDEAYLNETLENP